MDEMNSGKRERQMEIARRRGAYERHVGECDNGCEYNAEREKVTHCMVGEIMHVRHFAALREGK